MEKVLQVQSANDYARYVGLTILQNMIGMTIGFPADAIFSLIKVA